MKKKNIIMTERDRKVFFESISNPRSPNKELIKASKKYKNEKER